MGPAPRCVVLGRALGRHSAYHLSRDSENQTGRETGVPALHLAFLVTRRALKSYSTYHIKRDTKIIAGAEIGVLTLHWGLLFRLSRDRG